MPNLPSWLDTLPRGFSNYPNILPSSYFKYGEESLVMSVVFFFFLVLGGNIFPWGEIQKSPLPWTVLYTGVLHFLFKFSTIVAIHQIGVGLCIYQVSPLL